MIFSVLFDETTQMEIENTEFCECMGIQQKPKIREGARIPFEFKDCSINSFDISKYNDKATAAQAKRTAGNFVSNFITFKNGGKGLYIYSKTKGSGKTRLACSIANALIATQGISTKFMKTLDLLSMIKDTYKKDSGISEKEILDGIKNCKVLILDDIGAEKPTEWVCGVFLSLLDYRMGNRLVTLFTSNVRIDKLKLDERIVDRLAKMALEVRLPEESVRRKESEIENEKFKQILVS